MKSWIVAVIGLAIGSVIGILLSMLQTADGQFSVVTVTGTAPNTGADIPQQDNSPANSIIGQARIIDGDTLKIGQTKIRLLGIDTPENDQECGRRDGTSYRCGAVAGNRLRELVGLDQTRCEGDTRDRYGRLLATCYAPNLVLNAEMVRLGWAVAYRQYSNAYVSLENEARQAGRGIWQGRFQMPWDWRRSRHAAAPAAAKPSKVAMATETGTSGACQIKGNISDNGHIYHLPGSRWYARIRINPARGERWFCSTQEAEAAGWRKAG